MSPVPVDHDLPQSTDPVLLRALDQLLPGHEGEFPVGGRQFLVRLPHAGHQVRVRRWPAGTLISRVRFVHRLLNHLAAHAPGMASMPFSLNHGHTFTRIDDALVDVEHWLNGQPGGGRSTPQLPNAHSLHRPIALDSTTHNALVQRIADLHTRTVDFAHTPEVPTARVEHILREVNRSWADWRVRLRPAAPNYPPIQRWLRLGEQILPASLEALASGELDHQPVVINHANLWPAHTLVENEAIQLLDFDSAVAATPLLDLAQLITRFTGWTGEHAEMVIAGYANVRALTPDERRLLPAMAGLDLIIESARLLHFGFTGAIAYSSRQASAARNGALDALASLEAVQPAIIRAAERVPIARQRQLARIASGKTTAHDARQPNPSRPRAPKRRRKAD